MESAGAHFERYPRTEATLDPTMHRTWKATRLGSSAFSRCDAFHAMSGTEYQSLTLTCLELQEEIGWPSLPAADGAQTLGERLNPVGDQLATFETCRVSPDVL